MAGGLTFNQWLMNEGLLHFKEPVGKNQKFDQATVDRPKTKVWGEGGYYGRCFINVEGREPNGQVPAAEDETSATSRPPESRRWWITTAS